MNAKKGNSYCPANIKIDKTMGVSEMMSMSNKCETIVVVDDEREIADLLNFGKAD